MVVIIFKVDVIENPNRGYAPGLLIHKSRKQGVWNGGVTDRETMSDTWLTYHEPTGAGKGGDEYVAATRLIASIQSFISRWFLQKLRGPCGSFLNGNSQNNVKLEVRVRVMSNKKQWESIFISH